MHKTRSRGLSCGTVGSVHGMRRSKRRGHWRRHGRSTAPTTTSAATRGHLHCLLLLLLLVLWFLVLVLLVLLVLLLLLLLAL